MLEPQICGELDTSRSCPSNYTCSYSQNWRGLYDGALSMDYIVSTLLVTFLSLTNEGWTDIMIYVKSLFKKCADSVDTSLTYVWIYFIPLSFFGTYILLNCISGIICGYYLFKF